MMKKKSLIFANVFAVSVACLLLLPAAATADDKAKFQYAAKFVCGTNPAKTFRVVPGTYATAINIHNPNSKRVRFTKKVALTFPPAEQAPGGVSETFEDTLDPDEALEVDCEEIPSEFFESVPGTPYTKGFVIIKSNRSLDVTAVYTLAIMVEGQPFAVSIDVEEIRERKRRKRDDDDDDDDDD